MYNTYEKNIINIKLLLKTVKIGNIKMCLENSAMYLHLKKMNLCLTWRIISTNGTIKYWHWMIEWFHISVY